MYYFLAQLLGKAILWMINIIWVIMKHVQSILDLILLDDNPCARGHDEFAHIVKHEVSLHQFSVNASEFVILNVSSYHLSQIPYHCILPEPTHDEHLLVALPFIEFCWDHANVLNLA